MMLMQREEQLEFEFEFGCPYIEADYYREGAQDLIQRLIPPEFLEAKGPHLPMLRSRFADLLPLISWSDLTKAPCALSVLLLCKYRLNVSHFFYDMVSRWLLPHRRLNVELFFTSDVRLPHLSDELFTVAEVVVHLKSVQDVEEVRRGLHAIETEIRLGVVSHYHARRILEFKGLSADGKTAMIQEKISSLIQSHSKDFDQGIFAEMQHFLVTCKEEFKTLRDYHHISRIISNLYSLRKMLKQSVQELPTKRHVQLKLLKTRLTAPGRKEKEVLGLLVGFNFLKEHEVFEEAHLMRAIQKYLPEARLVEGSSLLDRGSEGLIQALYLEIERSDGAPISQDEIQRLRQHLPEEVKETVELLTHPLFMPRNEEEVLKGIMNLSRQLRYVSDLPQVIISFDEQKGDDLCFTVTLVRVIGEGAKRVQDLFAASSHKFYLERVRQLGQLRRKYLKEATVARILLPAKLFLRSDRSIDLYQARAFILSELQRLFGEVRDYNGGMICKQGEALLALKASLGKTASRYPLLLEKFFYAINPMEMRTILEPEILKTFFLFFLQLLKKERLQEGVPLIKREGEALFALLATSQKTPFSERLEPLSIPHQKLPCFSLEMGDLTYHGFLLLSNDPFLQESFAEALRN